MIQLAYTHCFFSGSCIPLYNFSYIYEYIMSASTSFVDRWGGYLVTACLTKLFQCFLHPSSCILLSLLYIYLIKIWALPLEASYISFFSCASSVKEYNFNDQGLKFWYLGRNIVWSKKWDVSAFSNMHLLSENFLWDK